MDLFDELSKIDKNEIEIRDKCREESESGNSTNKNNITTTGPKNDCSNDLEDIENLVIKKLAFELKKQNEKLQKSKRIIENYKEIIAQKDEEISKLTKKNWILCSYIDKIPKIFRFFLIKDLKK